MNTKEIEILLDKYFEALTTVDEENILRSYFQREDIADHLKSVQSLFWLIERQKAEKTEIDHEERLMEKISLKKEKGLHQKRLFYFASSYDFAETIKFQLTQERCDILDNFHIGEELKVSFNIRGRRWEKDGQVSYFNNLEAWKIEKVVAAPQEIIPQHTIEEIPPEPTDDLPF
jgi:hypothetical protein